MDIHESDYFVDILEPSEDLNVAMDRLGKTIGVLYQEAWDKNKKHLYDNKPFDLHINAFANMWFNRNLKLFIMYDGEGKAVGFFAGLVYRPMPYEASVFQVQEWYAKNNPVMEQQLFDYVVQAIRILGCDELWMQIYPDRAAPTLGTGWEFSHAYPIHRYLRKA